MRDFVSGPNPICRKGLLWLYLQNFHHPHWNNQSLKIQDASLHVKNRTDDKEMGLRFWKGACTSLESEISRKMGSKAAFPMGKTMWQLPVLWPTQSRMIRWLMNRQVLFRFSVSGKCSWNFKEPAEVGRCKTMINVNLATLLKWWITGTSCH